MALPGTPEQRISDLCNENHITQKQLAEKIGASAFQLSRIVSGETRFDERPAGRSCNRRHVSDHAKRTGRTKTGTAFYGRCNCYDCRADWQPLPMDGETTDQFQ